ncbi:MAG: hypothetical protein KGN02_12635 [bacterium]|nr:hypothetical protein [bacterium]
MLTALTLSVLVAAAPQPALAPGTYTYSASFGGQNVGTSTIVVKANGATTELDERMSGSFQGTAASGTATLVLGSDLAPVRYDLMGTVGGLPTHSSTTISGDGATETAGKGHNVYYQLNAGSAHFVVVDLGSFAGFLPLAAQMKAWSDAPVTAIVPSFQRSLAVAPIPSATPQRPANVPAADLSLSFGGDAPLTIWYDPATFVPDVIETAQGITVTRDAAAR